MYNSSVQMMPRLIEISVSEFPLFLRLKPTEEEEKNKNHSAPTNFHLLPIVKSNDPPRYSLPTFKQIL